MEGRSVRSTERSEARNVATRSEAKGHAQRLKRLKKTLTKKLVETKNLVEVKTLLI
jgi:hypothetical protein